MGMPENSKRVGKMPICRRLEDGLKAIGTTRRVVFTRNEFFSFFMASRQTRGRRLTQQQTNYFGVIAGKGYMCVAFFAIIFYSAAWLNHKGHISADHGAVAIIAYWISSIIYFLSYMCMSFVNLYRFFVERMRLYSRFSWISRIYVLGTSLCATAAIYLSFGFYDEISTGIENYSIKALLASYGASLFYSMIVMIMIANIVAVRRGVRCYKVGAK